MIEEGKKEKRKGLKEKEERKAGRQEGRRKRRKQELSWGSPLFPMPIKLEDNYFLSG